MCKCKGGCMSDVGGISCWNFVRRGACDTHVSSPEVIFVITKEGMPILNYK